MNRLARVTVSVVMTVVAALMALAAHANSVVHYELNAQDGIVERTDTLESARNAAIVCGVGAVLLLGWAVWSWLNTPRRLHWLAPAVVLAVAVVMGVYGMSVQTPTY
ncbi:MAG: hypothetical protein ACRDQA_28975 [Nocardioidaceae bacterium]